MYQAYRCEACGEVYLGDVKPEECPFCGAKKLHLKAMEEEEFEEILPEFQEKAKLVQDSEELPEISPEFMERLSERAKEEGFEEAYRLFVEHTSEDEADRFFKALGKM